MLAAETRVAPPSDSVALLAKSPVDWKQIVLPLEPFLQAVSKQMGEQISAFEADLASYAAYAPDHYLFRFPEPLASSTPMARPSRTRMRRNSTAQRTSPPCAVMSATSPRARLAEPPTAICARPC